MPRRPMRSLEEFCQYLVSRDMTPGTVIDVGACYGTQELLQSFPKAYHILVEPVPNLEPRLQNLLRRYSGECHMVALSDAEGEMQLSVPIANVPGASLTRLPGANTISVPVKTLDGLFGAKKLDGPILVKTDCQGYDMHVMRGGREFLKRVDVAVVETNMFHPTNDQSLPDFGDTVLQMRELGFGAFDIVSYQVRPRDDALGYVDMVFARESGPLRAVHRWA